VCGVPGASLAKQIWTSRPQGHISHLLAGMCAGQQRQGTGRYSSRHARAPETLDLGPWTHLFVFLAGGHWTPDSLAHRCPSFHCFFPFISFHLHPSSPIFIHLHSSSFIFIPSINTRAPARTRLTVGRSGLRAIPTSLLDVSIWFLFSTFFRSPSVILFGSPPLCPRMRPPPAGALPVPSETHTPHLQLPPPSVTARARPPV
jgi:hypothetical protein